LFWLVHYVEIIDLLSSPKNVINAVQSDGNLIKIGSLRKKMTMIGQACWHMSPTRTTRVCVCCDVTAKVEFGLIRNKCRQKS